MKFQIVEFYPTVEPARELNRKKAACLGTLHIYLVEEEMDIRGIVVLRKIKDGSFIFNFPMRFSIDEETRKVVRFPIVSFTNEKKHKELCEFLNQEGPKYIQEFLINEHELLCRASKSEITKKVEKVDGKKPSIPNSCGKKVVKNNKKVI